MQPIVESLLSESQIAIFFFSGAENFYEILDFFREIVDKIKGSREGAFINTFREPLPTN